MQSLSRLFIAFIIGLFLHHSPAVNAAPPILPDGYDWNLIFNDEFNAQSLDDSKWEHVPEGARRDGSWVDDAVGFDDAGNLVITTYHDEVNNYWNSGGIRTRDRFEHVYGYYEARVKFPTEEGHWPAFWLFSEAVHDVTGNGQNGTEIDVFEKPVRGDNLEHGLHWDGYEPDVGQVVYYQFDYPGLSNGFHTVGMWWTENEYIYYVDGKETWRSNAGGVSHVPQYIKLTEEIEAWTGDITKANLPDHFLVDYVRVYELDPDANTNLPGFTERNPHHQPTNSMTGGNVPEFVDEGVSDTGSGSSGNDGDSDNDKLPDTYENNFDFLDASYAGDAGDDEDGDGKTNLTEYLRGTDPLVYDPSLPLDLNNDGKSDILWQHAQNGRFYAYYMDGNGIAYHQGIDSYEEANWQIAGTGDFNADGFTDILMRNIADGENRIWFINGEGVAADEYINHAPPEGWDIAGVGDLNNDGYADIVWRNHTSGKNQAYLMRGSQILSSALINTVTNFAWEIVGIGEFNGDGYSDLLWRNMRTGVNWMYLMNGSTITASVEVNTVSHMQWKIVALGDLNGDAKDDIVWRHGTSGKNWVYLMDGNTIAANSHINTVSNLDWDIVDTGDYDGDGHDDLLWRNGTTGRNWTYLMNGATVASSLGINTVSNAQWQIVGK